MHLKEGMANVPHNLEANRLHIVGNLVQSHSVHLDGSRPLLLLEVNIAHVHTETPAKGILLVLDNLRVDGQGFIVLRQLLLPVTKHTINQPILFNQNTTLLLYALLLLVLTMRMLSKSNISHERNLPYRWFLFSFPNQKPNNETRTESLGASHIAKARCHWPGAGWPNSGTPHR